MYTLYIRFNCNASVIFAYFFYVYHSFACKTFFVMVHSPVRLDGSEQAAAISASCAFLIAEVVYILDKRFLVSHKYSRLKRP